LSVDSPAARLNIATCDSSNELFRPASHLAAPEHCYVGFQFCPGLSVSGVVPISPSLSGRGGTRIGIDRCGTRVDRGRAFNILRVSMIPGLYALRLVTLAENWGEDGFRPGLFVSFRGGAGARGAGGELWGAEVRRVGGLVGGRVCGGHSTEETGEGGE